MEAEGYSFPKEFMSTLGTGNPQHKCGQLWYVLSFPILIQMVLMQLTTLTLKGRGVKAECRNFKGNL